MAGKGGLAARIGWVMAASGPPVAVAGVWRDLVVDHPVIAVVLLIIYELLVAAVAFAGEIVRELRKRWLERIIDPVDRALVRRVSRFDRRYRDFVLGSLRFIDLKGPDLRKLSSGRPLTSYIAQAELCKSRLTRPAIYSQISSTCRSFL